MLEAPRCKGFRGIDGLSGLRIVDAVPEAPLRGCGERDPSKLEQERVPSGLKVRFGSVVPRPPSIGLRPMVSRSRLSFCDCGVMGGSEDREVPGTPPGEKRIQGHRQTAARSCRATPHASSSYSEIHLSSVRLGLLRKKNTSPIAHFFSCRPACASDWQDLVLFPCRLPLRNASLGFSMRRLHSR